MNQKRDLIFTELLNYLVNKYKEEIERSGYPYAPFIPYAFPEYGKSNPKVFYIGIGTYYWGHTSPEVLLQCYENRDYTELFHKNDSTVTVERIMDEWGSKKGIYWDLISRMQLFLNSGQLKKSWELNELTEEERSIINGIGIGNCYPIEPVGTLKKEEEWENINEELYWKLRNAVQNIFCPVKNILQSYEPDVIFILGADNPDSLLFRGLQYEHLEGFDEKKWRKLYKVKDFDTKIIKTYNPRGFHFQGSNNDEMIPYLAKSLELFNKIIN